MRERLIELIQKSVNGCARHWAEVIADYLLENGVIVLPCKDDDTVFVTLFGQILPFDVISTIIFGGKPMYKAQHGFHLVWVFELDDIGKTVFLTREEAENALKEREKA